MSAYDYGQSIENVFGVTPHQTEINRLKRELAQLEQRVKEAEAAQRQGWDHLKQFENLTVIRFDKKFGRASYAAKTYTYAALKVHDQWFLTNTGGKTHPEMVRFMEGVPRAAVLHTNRLVNAH